MGRGRTVTAGVVLAVVATGCGLVGGDDDAGESSELPSAAESAPESGGPDEEPGGDPEVVDDDRDGEDVVVDAVDATLGADRLRIDSTAELTVEGQEFSLYIDGGLDYEALVADIAYGLEQADGSSEVDLVSDGTRAWLQIRGASAPDLPEDAAWVEGRAEDAAGSPSFDVGALLAVLVALRATEEVTELEPATYDGVETRVYSTTVSYVDAVAAAGDQEEAFTQALSLQGGARRQADLEITVAVGPDDVIRDYDLDIAGATGVSGGYDVSLTEVGEELAPPEPPDRADVAGGEDGEELFAELVGS